MLTKWTTKPTTWTSFLFFFLLLLLLIFRRNSAAAAAAPTATATAVPPAAASVFWETFYSESSLFGNGTELVLIFSIRNIQYL